MTLEDIPAVQYTVNATPLENIYIKNVKRYADNFNYYEKRKVRK